VAIKCKKDQGPQFGIGELLVINEPFNEPNACWSMGNYNGFKIPVNDEGINMLTNKKSLKNKVGNEECHFTIKEIEVWGVTFK
jgi:DNA modification methylase